MSLMLYNTLSRRKEAFAPIAPPKVGLYTCGPTVYDYAHIGNFRAYVFEDLLRRVLRFHGFDVVQVMNLTDVDDKTIRGARAAGMGLNDYTRKFKDAFYEDLKTLNIQRAEVYPSATEHVPEMIELIETLLRKGVAYISDDGSVYFSISRFPAYGQLARLDMTGLQPGARVAQDEYQKENVADFALWKAWSDEDGDVVWDSPWGRGRPGWHIECSAMSMKYLGPSFDIHTGGVDNIFPHHEDEIAQSEAATGQPFVKYWLHCGYLLVDEKKMSKSAGNFHTLRNLIERGFTGRDVRFSLISAHYRQSLNFTFEALEAARSALGRLDEFMGRLRENAKDRQLVSGAAASGWVEKSRSGFLSALDDDLNIAEALAVLFGLVHEGNRRMDAGSISNSDAQHALAALDDFDRILGVLGGPDDTPPAEVLKLADDRQASRKAKDWDAADRFRDAITRLGWNVQDTSGGYKLKRTNCR